MLAETAAALNTPLPFLMELDYDEVLRWHDEAAEIVKARGF